MPFAVGNRVALTESISTTLVVGTQGSITNPIVGGLNEVHFDTRADGGALNPQEDAHAFDHQLELVHQQVPAPNHLEVHLWNIAVAEAGPIGIGPQCEGFVKNLIHVGVNNLRVNGMLDDPVRVAVAENNLRQFVRAMKQRAAGLNQNYLGENTFFPTFNQLCPLFPFC